MRLFNARFEERDKQDPRELTKIRQGIEVTEGISNFPRGILQGVSERSQAQLLHVAGIAGYLPTIAGEEKLRATVELHKRFAASLACVAFALIAVPLGITAHRKETSVGFALSLVIAFTYFFFIIMADTFRETPLRTRPFSSGFRTSSLSPLEACFSGGFRRNSKKTPCR